MTVRHRPPMTSTASSTGQLYRLGTHHYVRTCAMVGGPAELMTMTGTPPTLYEWAGRGDAFERLTDAFYARVLKDDLLAPLFTRMPPEHAHHVALWLAEVFGGPDTYTREHGGYPHMLAKHLGMAITEPQRRRWVTLI